MMKEESCKLGFVNEDISIHWDWISFTFPLWLDNRQYVGEKVSAILEKFCSLIGFSSEELRPEYSKKNNYEQCFKLGEHIAFRYGGESSKMKFQRETDGEVIESEVESLQIEFSGQGCREVEERGVIDWNKLLAWFYNDLNGRARRIDIALDDKLGFLPISWVRDKIAVNKEFTTRFRKAQGKELPFMPSGTLQDGYSILFGSRLSTMMLLIYDKKKEREYRNDRFMGSNWVRWELRFLKDKADIAGNYYLKYSDADMGKFYMENLTQMLQIRTPLVNGRPTDIKQAKFWDLDPRWEKFTSSMQGIKLTCMKRESTTIDRKVAWRDYALSRMHVQLDFANAYDEKQHEYINPIIPRLVHELEQELKYIKEGKIDDADLAMINSHRRNIDPNAKLLTVSDLVEYTKEIENTIGELKETYQLPF